MWRRKGSDHDPKHSTSSVKHGGASVMAWARMAASRTGFLRYIDDVTPDKSSRKNSEVFQAILSAHILPKSFRTHWTMLHSACGQWPKAYCKSMT